MAKMNTAIGATEPLPSDTGERPWLAVATSAQVTTRPLAVVVEDRRIVLVRLDPAGPAVAFADRCPHRRVPLSAGTVVDGRLRCAYHGWSFDASGRCADLPTLRPGEPVPPNAHLAPVVPVREEGGQVLVRIAELPAGESAPAELTNLDPALSRAWHPLALSDEVGVAPQLVMLLGQLWTMRRWRGRAVADPIPYALRERWGLIWLAPREPLVEPIDDLCAPDAGTVSAWLPPVRTTSPAATVADHLLDAWHPHPAGYAHRPPFQLVFGGAESAARGSTLLCFVAPEQLASSRVYVRLVLHRRTGAGRPSRADLAGDLARELALTEAALARELALLSRMNRPGLPLDPAAEAHVEADRPGVALRRELRRMVQLAGDGDLPNG
jgi:nitrite reductase/ring-hydroxylating ferredoxin subunit